MWSRTGLRSLFRAKGETASGLAVTFTRDVCNRHGEALTRNPLLSEPRFSQDFQDSQDEESSRS
jgi:hypothetical protein